MAAHRQRKAAWKLLSLVSATVFNKVVLITGAVVQSLLCSVRQTLRCARYTAFFKSNIYLAVNCDAIFK